MAKTTARLGFVAFVVLVHCGSSETDQDGHGMEGHLVPGQLFEDQPLATRVFKRALFAYFSFLRSPPSPHGQVVEVPMKVPLPIRPMDRSPLLPRCGPGHHFEASENFGYRLWQYKALVGCQACSALCRGLGPVEDFHDVPSSNLVPTPLGYKKAALLRDAA